MAYTVAFAFNALLADLALTARQQEIAEGRIARLNQWFRSYVACVAYPEVIGSYERGTVIRWRRDIDTMVVLAYNAYWGRYGSDSSSLLRWLRDRLNDAYGDTQVSTRQVAVRMFLGEGLNVDLVPMFNRPAGGFMMPDGKGSWQATNPPFHNLLMMNSNLRLNVRLKPLVKLMKAWNEANGRHLRSFHLEMMVEEMWQSEASVPDYADAVATTLRKGRTWIDYPLSDPWLGSTAPLDAYLSPSERARVSQLFAADCDRATEAVSHSLAGRDRAAFERWDIIFNGKFPAYG